MTNLLLNEFAVENGFFINKDLSVEKSFDFDSEDDAKSLIASLEKSQFFQADMSDCGDIEGEPWYVVTVYIDLDKVCKRDVTLSMLQSDYKASI